MIGENSTGKTHLLKILYSACRSNRADVEFGHKIVRTMLPDDYRIARLVTKKQGKSNAQVMVSASDDSENTKQLKINFTNTTKKWNGEITGSEGWGKSFVSDSSIFIPAKEILSHSYKSLAPIATLCRQTKKITKNILMKLRRSSRIPLICLHRV